MTGSVRHPRRGTRLRLTTRWQTQSVRKSPRNHSLPQPTAPPFSFSFSFLFLSLSFFFLFFFLDLLVGGGCLYKQRCKTFNLLDVIPFFPMLTPLATTRRSLELRSCITRWFFQPERLTVLEGKERVRLSSKSRTELEGINRASCQTLVEQQRKSGINSDPRGEMGSWRPRAGFHPGLQRSVKARGGGCGRGG